MLFSCYKTFLTLTSIPISPAFYPLSKAVRRISGGSLVDGKVINKVLVSQYYYNLLSQNRDKTIKANISQGSYLEHVIF